MILNISSKTGNDSEQYLMRLIQKIKQSAPDLAEEEKDEDDERQE